MIKYGIKKLRKDGSNTYNSFRYTLEVGSLATAPDWNPTPECGGGLHLVNPYGEFANFALLNGDLWCVAEYDDAKAVQLDGKVKVPSFKIVFLNKNPKGMLSFFDISKFCSRSAYCWARDIGDKEIMRDRVTESQWACCWVCDIGDKEIMMDRVTKSRWHIVGQSVLVTKSV